MAKKNLQMGILFSLKMVDILSLIQQEKQTSLRQQVLIKRHALLRMILKDTITTLIIATTELNYTAIS